MWRLCSEEDFSAGHLDCSLVWMIMAGDFSRSPWNKSYSNAEWLYQEEKVPSDWKHCAAKKQSVILISIEFLIELSCSFKVFFTCFLLFYDNAKHLQLWAESQFYKPCNLHPVLPSTAAANVSFASKQLLPSFTQELNLPFLLHPPAICLPKQPSTSAHCHVQQYHLGHLLNEAGRRNYPQYVSSITLNLFTDLSPLLTVLIITPNFLYL